MKGLIIAPGLDNYLAAHTLNTEKAPYVAFIVTDKSVELLAEILEKLEYTPTETKKFFVKDVNSLTETTQEFFHAFNWLTENLKVKDIAVDATNILPSMAFPVYFAASFIEVFKGLIGEDVNIRLLFTNTEWKTIKGDVYAHGEPIIGSEKTIQLEHPVNSIGFILGVMANNLFNEGFYTRAEKVFGELEAYTLGEQHLLYKELAHLAKAYDLWDKFNTAEALKMLQENQEHMHNIGSLSFLNTLQGDIEKGTTALEKLVAGDQVEEIIDIFENAERRMAQEKFDDAVARYYRCLDMIAQYALASHGITTEKPDFSKVSKDVVDQYAKERGGSLPQACKDGVGGIALKDAYLLLYCLKHPLGELYKTNELRFTGLLSVRNQSILAHGIKAISKERAEQFRDSLAMPFLEKLAEVEKFNIEEARTNHRFPLLPASIKNFFPASQ